MVTVLILVTVLQCYDIMLNLLEVVTLELHHAYFNDVNMLFKNYRYGNTFFTTQSFFNPTFNEHLLHNKG